MASWPWILIGVGALIVVLAALFVMKARGARSNITPLTGLAMAFIISAMVFEARWVGYSLMGAGVILVVVDMVLKLRAQQDGQWSSN